MCECSLNLANIAVCIGVGAMLAGCAAHPPSDEREARLGDNLRLYVMYDNSRDWGPDFLVGPPSHHLGDQSRIDDTRLVPRVDSLNATFAVGPSAAAARFAAQAPPTAKTILPPLP